MRSRFYCEKFCTLDAKWTKDSCIFRKKGFCFGTRLTKYREGGWSFWEKGHLCRSSGMQLSPLMRDRWKSCDLEGTEKKGAYKEAVDAFEVVDFVLEKDKMPAERMNWSWQ